MCMIYKWGFNMASFVVCIVSAFWHFYNFIGYIFPMWELPYFRIAGESNTLIRVLNMVCLGWSPVIGLMLLVFGVVGILVRKHEENNFESFKYFMFAFALVADVGLML